MYSGPNKYLYKEFFSLTIKCMKPKTIKKKEKEDSNVSIPGLIIAMLILIAVCLGIFFLTRWFITNSRTPQEEVTEPVDENKVTTDRLLKLLNDNIDKTKVGEETPASEITSFSYQEKHFYISGYNGSIVYQYDLDLSSQSYVTCKEALDYIMVNDVEGSYEITLNRCTPIESSEFVNKYITSGVSGKYHVASFGSEQYVYATILNDEQIIVINGDTLSDTLDASYSPLTLNSGDPLFDVYKYIANK